VTSTSQAPAGGALHAAEQERARELVALARKVSVLLVGAMGPAALLLYGLQAWLVPSWQANVLLALAAGMWALLVASAAEVARERLGRGIGLAFAAIWGFCAAAVVLRAGSFAIACLGWAAALVLLWVVLPHRLTAGAVLVTATAASCRALEAAGLLPQAPTPPAYAAAFDLGFTLTILPALAYGLTFGSHLQAVLLRALDVAGRRNLAVLDAVARSAPEVAHVSAQASLGAVRLATSASQQAATVDRVSSAASELEQLLRAAADETEQTRATADASRKSSAVTASALEGVERQLAGFQAALEAMARGVEALSERSAGTERMIESVEDVHRAVTVLSINARLEAARAGESGRGFAAVAAEMAALIAGTETSVKEGRRLLGAIRAEAGAMRDGARTSSAALVRHVDALRDARERVQAVLDGYGAAAESLDRIAAGGLEQRRQVEVVAGAMRELAGTAAELHALAAGLATSVDRVATGQKELGELVEASATPGSSAPARA